MSVSMEQQQKHQKMAQEQGDAEEIQHGPLPIEQLQVSFKP